MTRLPLSPPSNKQGPKSAIAIVPVSDEHQEEQNNL